MIYGIRKVFSVAAITAAFWWGPAAAGQQSVVVELFTSQGCSSCPPADAYLVELAGRDDVIALSFHVDYWNYIGWTDPYSSPQWTKRQQAYLRELKRRYVYTPQMVIDGLTETVGSRRGQVERLISAARKRQKLKIDVTHPDGGNVRIAIPERLADRCREAAIWIAFYDAKHTTSIGAGENDGVTMTNANVVRSMRRIGTWRGDALELKLALADLGAKGRDACAVLVQERGSGRIIGAASIPLAKTMN